MVTPRFSTATQAIQAYSRRFGPLINNTAFDTAAREALSRLGVTGARNELRRQLNFRFSNADFSRYVQEVNKSRTAGASIRRVNRNSKPGRASLITTGRSQSKSYQYHGSFIYSDVTSGITDRRAIIFNSDTALTRGEIEDRLMSIVESVEETILQKYDDDVEVSDVQLESAWYNPTVRPIYNPRLADEV